MPPQKDDDVTAIPNFQVAVNQIDIAGWTRLILEAIREMLPEMLQTVFKIAGPTFTLATLGAQVRSAAVKGKALGDMIDQIERESEGAYVEMAAVGLSDFFGVPVSPGELRAERGIGKESPLTLKLGQLVIRGLLGALENAQRPTPEQGLRNAERVIGFNLSTALEGWLMGTMNLGFITEHLPNYADLDDVMQQSLGLGRINRRVLQPFLDALIIQPLTEHVNLTYRPKEVSQAELLRARIRGLISEEQFFDRMAREGFSRDQAALYSDVNHTVLDESTIQRALELEFVNDDTAKALLLARGYHPTSAELKLEVWRDDRVRSIHTAIETQAREMYRERQIDRGEFERVLRSVGRSDAEVQALTALGEMELAPARTLSQSQIEGAFIDGIVPLDRVRAWYRAEGFALDDILVLEQVLLKRKFEEEERERARAAAAATKAQKPRT